MLIDTRNEEILFTINEHYAQISYEKAEIDSKEFVSLRIEESCDDPSQGDDEYDPQELKNYFKREDSYEYDQSYDISTDEIEDKINSCLNLDKSQRAKIKHLIMRYKEVFQKRPGLLSDYEYNFNLKDNLPYYSKPNPVPINYRDKVEAEINKWLELGIIRRSKSPYINSLVIVIKKDASVRPYLDARKLNKKLVDDHEAPPGIEEVFLKCRNIKYLLSFDLTSSFHQVRLLEASKQYTALMCDNKVYEFNVVAFGIKTSSAALIRGLDIAVGDLENFLITFVDDLLCMSEDFEGHMRHLELMFERLLTSNLKLNFKKSNFLRKEVAFLGHVLTAEGLSPNSEKIRTIKNFK